MNIKPTLISKPRRLQKAYDKLSKGVPNPRIAESNVDRALEEVISLLLSREIADNLDCLIIKARKELEINAEKFDALNTEQKQKLLLPELKVLRDHGFRQSEILILCSISQEVKHEREKFVSNSEELCIYLENLHKKYKSEIEASRKQPRKQKKRRKRKVLQGVVTTTLAVGAIIVDLEFLNVFPFSYELGAGALFQAIRDFIGDPSE